MHRLDFSHMIGGFCLLIGSIPALAYTDALITNRCAVLLAHTPAIIRASIPKPVLQKSERIQIEGQAGSVSQEKLSDIHAGLIQTEEQLEGIGLRVPKMTHVLVDPTADVSPFAFPYRLIRFREERLIYLHANNSEYEHQSGITRIVANHEMIHLSMYSTFSHSARVNESGLLREAFANFLSFHFDPETYRKEAAFHPRNLEYNNQYNMGAPRQGPKRTEFSDPTIWGDNHEDGALLGHFLLRMRNLIGPDDMNKFLRAFIPALNQFSLPDSIHADIELSGADRTSWGKVVIEHNRDLLLSLALIDRFSREWLSIGRLLSDFCAATEAKMSLDRLRQIEQQLVRGA